MVINFIHIPKNGGSSIRESTNNSSSIVYNGHDTDVYNTNLSNQLVVIRNPIDRFISSVYYSLQIWSHEPQVKYLISKNIDTPDKWVQIWSDPKHPYHDNLMLEMINKSHFIGNKLNKYKWTYSPQNLWINNPKFVIIMDNFKTDLQYFFTKYKIKHFDIKKINSTHHKDYNLSVESIDFLKNFYKEDFILYEKYKNMSIEKRL